MPKKAPMLLLSRMSPGNKKHHSGMFSCGRCNTTYYGKTCRHLSAGVGKHSIVSPLTGKKSNPKESTADK